ncbi:hypothetical protein LCGC14_2405640, partial [marine sediment metagenome]
MNNRGVFEILEINIAKLKPVLGEKKIFLYQLEEKEEMNKNFRIIGYIIKQLRQKKKNFVIFQHKGNIASENDILDYLINSKIVKEMNLEFKSSYEIIDIEKAINIESIEELFLRYIGERIAVQLRNKEDKYIVYEERNQKSIYQATSPIHHKIFDKIIVHSGFKYKPIILKKEKTIGVVIEPKFKFFSAYSMRQLIDDNFNLNVQDDYYVEKICPIEKCEYYLNPYGLCELSYPESFGKFQDLVIDNKEKPSDKFNLIDFYSQETICPIGNLANEIRKTDKPPVIYKYFWKNPEPYKYPINVLRFIPKTKDAGSFSRQLMKEIQPKIHQRYLLFKEKFFKSITDVSDLDYPIVPISVLNEDDNDVSKFKCTDPNYILKYKTSEFPSYDYKTDHAFKQIPDNSIEFMIITFDKFDHNEIS